MEILQDVNIISITLRLTLATIFAGVIGLDRGMKKRPAGIRTHILVCIGATIIMITNQYIFETIAPGADPTRLGAQVISGIGFLGAGTIIIDGRNHVRGLTTAAGLWACACMGLAIGIGFYQISIIALVFLFGVMKGLERLDARVQKNSKTMNIYCEFEYSTNITEFVKKVKTEDICIEDLEIHRNRKDQSKGVVVLMTLRYGDKINHSDELLKLHQCEGVVFIEEIC